MSECSQASKTSKQTTEVAGIPVNYSYSCWRGGGCNASPDYPDKLPRAASVPCTAMVSSTKSTNHTRMVDALCCHVATWYSTATGNEDAINLMNQNIPLRRAKRLDVLHFATANRRDVLQMTQSQLAIETRAAL